MNSPTSTAPDPFELLSSMRSPDIDRYLEPGDEPAADALLASILAGSVEPSGAGGPPRRRWPRRVVGGAVVLAVAGGGAVAASRLLAEPTDTASLSCYSDASAEPAIQVAMVIDPSVTPAQQCAPMWSDGTLGTSGAPELASCVTDTGITAVIPGTGDTCVDIGFDERAPTEPGSPNPAAAITNAISDTWSAEDRCIRDVDEAVAMLEQIIADAGADGWTVEVLQPPTDDMPCVGAGVNAQAKQIFTAAYPDGH
ncbi:MAG: hypothetical protein CL424_19740 [Acidimicrobiaceae bacterium]|nr:hypothetical protein [Acidimicrobiaceae bacterium]